MKKLIKDFFGVLALFIMIHLIEPSFMDMVWKPTFAAMAGVFAIKLLSESDED